MLPWLVQHPLNNFYIFFSFVFSVDKNIIKIYYYKNIKVFCQDLVDIILECCRYISHSKRYYLVLKVVIVGPKAHFSFIIFSNSHPIVGINQVKLDKTSSPT